MSIESRLNKLEDKADGGGRPCGHAVAYQIGEDGEAARARYEAETGRKIRPEDTVYMMPDNGRG